MAAASVLSNFSLQRHRFTSYTTRYTWLNEIEPIKSLCHKYYKGRARVEAKNGWGAKAARGKWSSSPRLIRVLQAWKQVSPLLLEVPCHLFHSLNSKERQRIPFYRNPKPPLYQSRYGARHCIFTYWYYRVEEMKKNFKMAPIKRAVRRLSVKSLRAT